MAKREMLVAFFGVFSTVVVAQVQDTRTLSDTLAFSAGTVDNGENAHIQNSVTEATAAPMSAGAIGVVPTAAPSPVAVGIPVTPPPIAAPSPVGGGLPAGIIKSTQNGYAQTGVRDFIYESIPRMVKLKYKLIQWFEDMKTCPLPKATETFPAWRDWKTVTAAAPAVTTPNLHITGNRTVTVHGFCGMTKVGSPGLHSSDFTCTKTSKEIKATWTGKGDARGIRPAPGIVMDSLICALTDISLYKMADGFVGVRLDFGECTGSSQLTSIRLNPDGNFTNPKKPWRAQDDMPHVPTSASMNMGLGQADSGIRVDQDNEFDKFFKAVCGGGEEANFYTAVLPKFGYPQAVLDPNDPTGKNCSTVVPPDGSMFMPPGEPAPAQCKKLKTCFAESGDTAHVIGKGCFPDFLFFNLQDTFGKISQIPVKDKAGLTAMIPGTQHWIHHHGVAAPAAAPAPAPGPVPASPATVGGWKATTTQPWVPPAGGGALPGLGALPALPRRLAVPADPCAPVGNCKGFQCDAPMTLRPQPERLTCLGGTCTADTCCLLPDHPTCEGFVCAAPMKLRPQPERLTCLHDQCTAHTCCLYPEPTEPPPEPCTTATPAPATCAGFVCDAPLTLRPQPERLTCLNGHCTADTCCLVPATQTPPATPCATTTPASCAGFVCPSPMTLRPQPERLSCPYSECTAQTCCLLPMTQTPPATPCATTTPKTCAGFVCVAPMLLRPQAGRLTCYGGECTADICCLLPNPSCAGFICVSPLTLRPQPELLHCDHKACTADTCCLFPTTLAPTTTTTTPVPEVPGVVVQDRICFVWSNCGCENNCTCTPPVAEQSGDTTPTTTTAAVRPPPPCLDCPFGSFLIGMIALLLTALIAGSCYFKLIRPSTISITSDENTAKWTTKNDDKFAHGHLGTAFDNETTTMGRGAPYESRVVTKKTETVNQMSLNFFLNFIMVGIISFIVVHVVWLVWFTLWSAFDITADEAWGINCINAWVCPYTLWGVWIAIWLAIWLGLYWLYGYEVIVETETQNRAAEGWSYGGYESSGGACAIQ